jgi:eukaryotic-like serine/threonine-protein kinase
MISSRDIFRVYNPCHQWPSPMALTNGTKLGPYEIVAPLGAGGMGEVYRARDTRLERTVAIKILPAQLSLDPVRKQRFEREAKTISSLTHPHICVLHDVGHQDGMDYLVMECVEGETLAKRLEKGPLPLDQVLKFGAQVADALDKAHRSGVVHRDLKPGNIMLTPTGAKLLDFGLAKPATTLPAGVPLTASMHSPVTEQGTIIGTFQYMSPEQIEGKELDGRSDIFSLGAVLYEMLTGQRAFQGKSQLNVASAILEKEPAPISILKPMTPPAFHHAIRRCLAKDPEERWQKARDLEWELNWIAEAGSELAHPPTAGAKAARGADWQPLIVSLCALVFGAVIASLATWNLKPTPPRPVTRTTITLPPGERLVASSLPAMVFSPDGNRLVYNAIQDGTRRLYLRAMDSLEGRPIPGTEGAEEPFFSPDGQWLGFSSDGKLKKVSLSGGAPLTVGDMAQNYGSSWGSQGMIALALGATSVLGQVSDAGGPSRPLTRFEQGEIAHRYPEFLPGGKAVLFAASNSRFDWTDAQVAVQSIQTGERRNLIGGMQPRYAASGHLIYGQGGNLMAVPFDPRRLAVTGAAVPVVEGVLQSTVYGVVQYSVSASGSLAYVPGGTQAAAPRKLVWVSRNGAEQPIGAPERAYRSPRLSPDGRQVAVAIEGQEKETQTWLYDLSRETLTRLTFEGNYNVNAIWTPDGKRIAFESAKEGPQNIFWQRADGSGGLERLTTSDRTHVPMSWSPDGKFLAFMESSPSTGYDIWVLRLGDRKALPFLQTPFSESAPRFSPNGRWLAYLSNESGRYEIYVQPYPGPGRKLQVSTEGGTEPAWNPNGRELFYRSGDRMMAVEVTTQPALSAGKPRMLFEGRYVPTPATFPNYDVSPDGERFLMLKPNEEEASAATQIEIVLNWFEELKHRAPPASK